MILHDPIPELRGGVCRRLIRQEFWYRGERQEEANVVFLQVARENTTTWHRFFIDAGVCFWKTVDEPDACTAMPEEECHYPQIETTEQYGLAGREIEAVSAVDVGMASALRIWLSGGVRLALRNERDCSTFAIFF